MQLGLALKSREQQNVFNDPDIYRDPPSLAKKSFKALKISMGERAHRKQLAMQLPTTRKCRKNASMLSENYPETVLLLQGDGAIERAGHEKDPLGMGNGLKGLAPNSQG